MDLCCSASTYMVSTLQEVCHTSQSLSLNIFVVSLQGSGMMVYFCKGIFIWVSCLFINNISTESLTPPLKEHDHLKRKQRFKQNNNISRDGFIHFNML